MSQSFTPVGRVTSDLELKMVMVKEKLNLYMKNQHLDDSMVEEKFGIDFDLLSMLSRKEYDEDGNVTVRWGEQKVS